MKKIIIPLFAFAFGIHLADAAPTLTSSSRRMYTPDPHSLDIVEDDDGIPRMEVRGFTTPTAARTGYNFADILTNKNVSVSNLMVLLRDGTGDNRELKYADLAKIVGYSGGGDGGHGVDDLSVTTNSDNNATLVGFGGASEWDIAYVSDENGKNKLAWGRIDDGCSITTFVSDGALLDGRFSIHGFQNADSYTFPYKTANETVDWANFDDQSFGWDGEWLYLKDIYQNDGRFLYSDNGTVAWGDISADEYSVTRQTDDGTWTFSLTGFEDASAGHLPFKGSDKLEWGGIVGDGQTVEFEGLFDGLDSMIYLHGADQPANFDKYAYIDHAGELQWIDPVENKSTQIYKYAGFNRVQLYGWSDGQKALPYNNGSNLAWLNFQGSSSENKYLASNGESIFWVNNPQKGDKGDPGEPGAPGKDGTDGNPGEWITNHVADIVQLLSGSFVTSVNGETGDVVLKDLVLISVDGYGLKTSSYNGSEQVEVDVSEALYSKYSDWAEFAASSDYASVAGEIGPPPNTALKNAPLAKSAAPSTNAVNSASSASSSGLSFSANGSVLTITDGTHTWKLDAQ